MSDLIQKKIVLIEEIIAGAPPYDNQHGVTAWEKSFEARSKWFRRAILGLCAQHGAAYKGMVGSHALSMDGITVAVPDGYRQLLSSWAEKAGAA